jgi:drug/metabolite transporter (DMT)-like permease
VVFALILLAALCNASWNVLIKSARDKLLVSVLVAGGAMLLALAPLPFLAAPRPASWPFLAASTVLQPLYYVLLTRAYRRSDMSQAYPVIRGTAPLLVALASLAGLGQPLGLAGWLGVLVLCGGILAMAAGTAFDRRGSLAALQCAAVTATYTLLDGTGVRLAGAPLAYILWLHVLTGLPMVAWALMARRPATVEQLQRQWALGLAGGAATMLSYGLALWAMTFVPVAVVAALRETSILFGLALAGLILKEKVAPRRIGAACVILAGAIVLRLA